MKTRPECRFIWGSVLVLAIISLPTHADEPSEAFRAAAGKVCSSVVTIETVGGTQSTPAVADMPAFIVADGPTTGLIWSTDGLIVTSSFNFVRDPSVITVTLSDGRRFVAKLLARDEIRRLAMLKIDATGLPTPEWASRGDMRVGQWAIGLGRGHGTVVDATDNAVGGCTLTAGIVSGLERMSGLVVQTDAKLSPANFGGPLIDLSGRVIGVCVPIGLDHSQLSGVEWYDSGIGFAVPRWQVEASAGETAEGHNIRRGLLGVAVNPRVLDTVIVVGMGEPSPALRAGIKPGDRIVAIDDKAVGDFSDLRRVLRPRSAGEQVTVHIERKGKLMDVSVVLAVPEDIGPVPAPATEPSPSLTPATEPSDDRDWPVVPPSSGPS
jgi:serine protease Do